LNWFLWDEMERNKPICDFVAGLIHFRKTHAVLRQNRFLTPRDIDWHGTVPFHPDWSASSRLVAFSYKGSDPIYAAFNASFEPAQISLPPNTEWHKIVATSEGWERHHLLSPDRGERIKTFKLAPYSALLAKGYSREG
jgi:isoamylase